MAFGSFLADFLLGLLPSILGFAANQGLGRGSSCVAPTGYLSLLSDGEGAGDGAGARKVGTQGLRWPEGEKAGGVGSTGQGPLEGLPAGRAPVCDPFSPGRPLCLGDV